jgi:four helix bundle protein
MKENVIKTKSFTFAVEIANVSRRLVEQKEFVLSRQLLRSGTSIGANVKESMFASSRRDFAYRMTISLRECSETLFWLELLHASNYLEYQEFKILHDSANELLRILVSITKTARKNE